MEPTRVSRVGRNQLGTWIQLGPYTLTPSPVSQLPHTIWSCNLYSLQNNDDQWCHCLGHVTDVWSTDQKPKLKMTLLSTFFFQGDKLWKVSRSQHLFNRRIWEYVLKCLVYKVWSSFKISQCACAEATAGCGFDLKMFFRKFCCQGKSFNSVPRMLLELYNISFRSVLHSRFYAQRVNSPCEKNSVYLVKFIVMYFAKLL